MHPDDRESRLGGSLFFIFSVHFILWTMNLESNAPNLEASRMFRTTQPPVYWVRVDSHTPNAQAAVRTSKLTRYARWFAAQKSYLGHKLS